uniref:Fibronectin type III domain containing 3B n=1 Tax=Cebus imitator TaxID=2715852 RepID=A0A2K5S0S4_CEBIM
MYVTMMMTDQIPLELPPLLNGEVAMMPHLVNGDAAQQVILVQVNPGETFTIRAEDGTLQCIQGLTSRQCDARSIALELIKLFLPQIRLG